MGRSVIILWNTVIRCGEEYPSMAEGIIALLRGYQIKEKRGENVIRDRVFTVLVPQDEFE
jgi:hypothetical protein